MPAIRRALLPAPVQVLLLTLVLALSGLVSTAAAPSAHAAVHAASVTTGVKAVQIATTRQGTPYRRGGSGPGGFDCSGYTRWVYAKVGKSLPRTSRAQYRATVHVPASRRQPGDLVFFGRGSRVYHVGIYAGGGRIWHSPRAGDRVKLAKIWTSRVTYGRVR